MTVDPIAKCRCGKLFTPMEWAELKIERGDFTRMCPCGLHAVRIAPITLNDIKREYQKALEEK